jgi:hypothetical protein
MCEGLFGGTTMGLSTSSDSDSDDEPPAQLPSQPEPDAVAPLQCTEWATRLLTSLVCLGWRALQPPFQKLVVVTGCSGTDAPIVALAQIFGDNFKEFIHHAASAERNKVLRAWITANFKVSHILNDIAAFNGPLDSCDLHMPGLCNLANTLNTTDLFIAGFPCTPFSPMNQDRFKPGYNPFTSPAARPFFEIVQIDERSTASTQMPHSGKRSRRDYEVARLGRRIC